ncbi:unnamed protein product, partial [Ectocarpus sp. 12 AP-2014]
PKLPHNAGLSVQLFLQRLVLRRVPCVKVHVHPGVLRGILPVPRVPQQLLLPPRDLRQLHGGMRMRDDLLAIQQHKVTTP